jgi:hypothetical protein
LISRFQPSGAPFFEASSLSEWKVLDITIGTSSYPKRFIRSMSSRALLWKETDSAP